LIEELDERKNTLFEMFSRAKVSSFEQTASQETEPNFNLVEPRAMLGSVDKTNAVSRMNSKSSPTTHVLNNATNSFFSLI